MTLLFPAMSSAAALDTAQEPSVGTSGSAAAQQGSSQTVPVSSLPVPPIPAVETAGTTQGNPPGANQMTPTTAGATSSAVTAEGKNSPTNAEAGVAPSALIPTSNNVSATPQSNLTSTADANAAKNPTAQENTAVLVPNGAALPAQLLPMGSSESSPWTSYAAGGFLILGLAAAGVTLVRIRQGRSFGGPKSERQMQLVSSLALSPKRQILLVRVRDKEVALASTEHGITLLTEMAASGRTSQLLEDGHNEEPRKRKVQQRIVQEDQPRMIADSSESVGQETAIARSEMLMGALKNLREKNLRSKGSTPTQEKPVISSAASTESAAVEQRVLNNVSESKAKSEPTMKQTRAAFPKYLANAFEQESKRNISSAAGSTSTDDVGSVTTMIRERLKDLRPLS